jgi:hypothetical protein
VFVTLNLGEDRASDLGISKRLSQTRRIETIVHLDEVRMVDETDTISGRGKMNESPRLN